jgi:prepilin-type N-terminal cleavage/methylation domain-containing protein
MLQTMINRQVKTINKTITFPGFTLIEIVIVLAIISAMIVVVLPLCKRSNNGLQIKQDSSDIAQAIRYAADLAEKGKKAVKFIFNEKFKSFHLEVEDSENSFKPVEDFTGTERYIDKNVQLNDIDGFEQNGQEYFLIFDPLRPLPDAGISFSSSDLIVTIKIHSKNVEIEEQSI